MVMSTRQATLLQEIIETCRSFRASSNTVEDSPGSPYPSLRTPFAFPPIPDLSPELLAFGLSQRDVSMISNTFISKCAQLRCEIERIFYREEMLRVLREGGSGRLHDALRTCLWKLYAQKVAFLQSETLRCVRLKCNKIRSTSAKCSLEKQTKTSFNHDYVPVLEKYFEYNAYPSAADRALMARKSMMSERQIEVWFQNHRNRARKDGKTLNRLRTSDPLPHGLSFASLDEKMGDLIRPESERQSIIDSDESDFDDVELDEKEPSARTTPQPSNLNGPEVLDPPAPPHVFPSPYVSPSYTFLNAKSRQGTFPSPTWPRKPVTHSTRTSTLPISFDDFVDLFARMTVREGLRKQNRRRIAPLPQPSRKSPVPASTDGSAATCAITTILCAGRHPAFIPSFPSRPRAQRSPVPTVLSTPSGSSSRASPPPSHPLPSYPISEQPQALTSSVSTSSAPLSHIASPSTTPRRRRKSPPLPRRMPGSPPVAQSKTRSPVSRNSPYAHPYSSPSRNSSSTSIASSTGARSSSSSSTSSSTLATPNQPSISLPVSLSPMHASKSPSSAISLSNQSFNELFGDAGSNLLSPIDGPHLALPTGNSFGGPGMSRDMFDFNFGMAHAPSVVHAHS